MLKNISWKKNIFYVVCFPPNGKTYLFSNVFWIPRRLLSKDTRIVFKTKCTSYRWIKNLQTDTKHQTLDKHQIQIRYCDTRGEKL